MLCRAAVLVEEQAAANTAAAFEKVENRAVSAVPVGRARVGNRDVVVAAQGWGRVRQEHGR